MNSFYLNGYLWRIRYVDRNDPMLIDRTGSWTVATTDPKTGYIYLSNELSGDFLNRVLIHELGHCTMFSFGLLTDIHRMVYPEYWVEAEEWVCNFIADYGRKIFEITYSVLGEEAWLYIPGELERMIA